MVECLADYVYCSVATVVENALTVKALSTSPFPAMQGVGRRVVVEVIYSHLSGRGGGG